MACLRGTFTVVAVTGALLTCGEGPSGPATRHVTAVVISHDSVYLDVADSVVMRAEGRDVNGDAIPQAGIVWQSLDPTIATVSAYGATARVFAVAAGAVGVAATSEGHGDTTAVTVFPPIVATILTSHTDTAWAVGDTFAIAVSSQSAFGPRFGVYEVVSRSAAATATFDAPAHVHITAQVPGEAYVVVTERRGTRDSVLIVVRQRPAKVIVTPSPVSGFMGRSSLLTASVLDARDHPIGGAMISWRSADTTIAGVNATGLVSYRAIGRTQIIATPATGPADTTPVTVLPMPKLSLNNLVTGHSHDSLQVGAHQLSDTFYAYASDVVSPWVHLRVTDTTVATAPDSVAYVGAGGTFAVHGHRPGRTLLVGEATLMTPDTVRVRVLPARLGLGDPIDPGPIAIRGTDNVHFQVSPMDSAGTVHPIADTLVVTYRSSDSTVVDLFQSRDPQVLTPDGRGGQLFYAHAIDTGRAVIRATAPGYAPDSMVWRVVPGPKLHFIQGRVDILGAGQATVESRQIASISPAAPGDTLSVTLTSRRSVSAAVPSPVTLRGFTGTGLAGDYTVNALLPGIDTVIATAPGHEPDTAVITVTTPQILLPDSIRGNIFGATVEPFVGDSLGTRHAPADSLLLLATSSDTTVVRGSSTRIPARWLAFWPLSLPGVDTGVATITVRDSAGIYPLKHLAYSAGLADWLHVTAYDGYEFGPAGTQQQFEFGRFRLLHPGMPPSQRAVYLSTTVPGVLRLPDSVLVGGADYTFFPGAGGDVAGTTRIVATSRGFRPDTSGPITVGRGHLKLHAPTNAFVGGASPGYVAAVHALSPNGGEVFPMDQNLSVTLVPIDGGIVAHETSVTVPAGQTVSASTALTFTAPGALRVAAEDRRPVPAPFVGDTVVIESRLPPLGLVAPGRNGLLVGVGQRLLADVTRPTEVRTNAVTVDVTHRDTRSGSASTVVLSAGATFTQYTVDGRAIGSDTVTLSAPGYAVSTFPILVTEGRIALVTFPALLAKGDSVAVLVQVGDSALGDHAVVDQTTFAIETSGGITVSDGARHISEVTLPAGVGMSAPIYVKGTVIGAASVTLSNVYYAPGVFRTTITAPPAATRP